MSIVFAYLELGESKEHRELKFVLLCTDLTFIAFHLANSCFAMYRPIKTLEARVDCIFQFYFRQHGRPSL